MTVYSIPADHEIATCGADIGKERWERAACVATFEGQLTHALYDILISNISKDLRSLLQK